MTKYHAQKVEVDGYKFDSRREAERYWTLKQWQAIKVITGLQVHPSWPLEVNGQKIGRYTADFCYVNQETQEVIVEDVKSPPTRTEAYRLRKKLVKALWGVEVKEVA